MINFKQLNIRNVQSECKWIESLKQSDPNCLVIGLEITNKNLSFKVDVNIDPQHNFKTRKSLTCIEKTIQYLKNSDFIGSPNIWVLLLKPDLDTIGAAAIIKLFFEDPNTLNNKDVHYRIMLIARHDRHGRKWTGGIPKANEIPRGLFLLVSGWKNTLQYKITSCVNWLKLNKFPEMEKYNSLAKIGFVKSLASSKIEMIIPKHLVFIKSPKRGACGIGYTLAPIVVAMNPSFRFGLGQSRVYGRRWTIAQCNSKYINLNLVLNEILKIEPGWGGSSTIICSPQERPSQLKKQDIINIIKNIL